MEPIGLLPSPPPWWIDSLPILPAFLPHPVTASLLSPFLLPHASFFPPLLHPLPSSPPSRRPSARPQPRQPSASLLGQTRVCGLGPRQRPTRPIHTCPPPTDRPQPRQREAVHDCAVRLDYEVAFGYLFWHHLVARRRPPSTTTTTTRRDEKPHDHSSITVRRLATPDINLLSVRPSTTASTVAPHAPR